MFLGMFRTKELEGEISGWSRSMKTEKKSGIENLEKPELLANGTTREWYPRENLCLLLPTWTIVRGHLVGQNG